MVVQPSSTAWIRMATFQYFTAARRSSSCGLAHRYIGRSEAIFTPWSLSAFLKLAMRSG